MHSATKRSPYEVLFGKPPPTILAYVHGTCAVESVEGFLLERDKVMQEVHVQLCHAQNRMKKIYDGKHVERSFVECDLVYLKLHTYRQNVVAKRNHHKLAPKWFGPFRVLNKIGEVAYKLELPKESRIHPFFHVSLLKKTLGSQVEVRTSVLDEFQV